MTELVRFIPSSLWGLKMIWGKWLALFQSRAQQHIASDKCAQRMSDWGQCQWFLNVAKNFTWPSTILPSSSCKMRNQSRYKLHLYHFKLLWGIATSQVEAPYNNKPVYQRWDLLLVVFLLGRNYAKPSSRHFVLPWQPIFPAGLWPLMTTVGRQEK